MPNEILVGLAERANTAHAAAVGCAAKAIEHARRCGDLLLEAKREVSHGNWIPWLESNFNASRVTAASYMRVASRWGEIEDKCKAALHLTGALKMLAGPKDETPELSPPEQPCEANDVPQLRHLSYKAKFDAGRFEVTTGWLVGGAIKLWGTTSLGNNRVAINWPDPHDDRADWAGLYCLEWDSMLSKVSDISGPPLEMLAFYASGEGAATYSYHPRVCVWDIARGVALWANSKYEPGQRDDDYLLRRQRQRKADLEEVGLPEVEKFKSLPKAEQYQLMTAAMGICFNKEG